MNRKFTFNCLATALISLFMLSAQKAAAQSVETIGYINVYVKVVAVPAEGGAVCATVSSTGLKTYKEVFEFKQTLPVQKLSMSIGDNEGSTIYAAYDVYSRPNDGYMLNAWYKDTNNNGTLDFESDEKLGILDKTSILIDIDGNTTYYATKAEANAAGFPEEPTYVFAQFTRGASAGVSYYQDENGANCGTIFIDKQSNEPGDVVTVRAIPNDGFQFEYWEDDIFMGNVVSRENPYTFTVQGGERIYAYFTAIDAPEFDLPEEGGFKAFCPNAPWAMTDETLKNGGHILVFEAEDLTRTADGKVYLDMNKEEVQVDLAQHNHLPTIVYGKGKVKFAYKFNYGMARKRDNPLMRWSGDNGATLTGENVYIYVFHEDIGAFIQYANTDLTLNPNASTKVTIEPNVAFFWMSAFDLADENGQIPTVIGVSPETFDAAITGVEGVKINSVEVKGQKIYTLSGVEVKATDQKGIYIINGKKVLVK